MDRFDRIFDLHKLLNASRHPVSRQRIEQELECSRATAKRIIEAMRLYLNAPIVYDRERNGYYYDRRAGEMFELPGIWFNSSELHALLSVQQLLADVQPGLLERQLAPLRERIDALLDARHAGGSGLSGRIRILRAAARPAGPCFQTIASALARQLRVAIDYHGRSRDKPTRRIISPQRLVHYRDNWYLDAHCHRQNSLRTFSVDRISSAVIRDEPALDLAGELLDEHYRTAYGIFAGPARETAILRFSAMSARWVASETWHPNQQARWLEDGSYQLEIPYGNSAELVMDILKFGEQVEVIAPHSLRSAVIDRLQTALDHYRSTAPGSK